MPKYVALLRAINVGGRNKIKMADLKSSLEESGFQSVKTYLQSGNVLCVAKERSSKKLEQKIEDLIQKDFQLDIRVIVRSINDVRKMIDENPFSDPEKYPANRVGVCFLAEPTKLTKLEKGEPGNQIHFGKKHLYLFIPDGFGKTKWTNAYIEKQVGCPMTTRNLNTTNYIAAWEPE